MCAVPTSFGSAAKESHFAKIEAQEKSTQAEFDGSYAAQEIQDLQEFFQQHPKIFERVKDVLQARDCASYPRAEADTAVYTRRVVNSLRAVALTEIDQRPEDDDSDEFDPFFMVDLARPVIQYMKFKKNLPRVQPFFAMKCNPSPEMLEVLSALGCGFDCASKEEFQTILKGNYASPDDIIFAHPQKMLAHMRCAERSGVRMATFDCLKEVEKIATHMPSCKAVLRIATDDQNAQCAFSTKFGARMKDVPQLLESCKKHGVNVIGVSFHVGSGNSDVRAYVKAIEDAREVFDQGNALGFDMKLLDIGGGWPGDVPKVCPTTGKNLFLSFEEICAQIRPLMDNLFANATIIAEPGRFFAESTFAVAMPVHGCRNVTNPDGTINHRQAFVSDGLYGSFNCIVYDFARPELHMCNPDGEAVEMKKTTIWGPTCDSADVLLKETPYPELTTGDWLFLPNFGAYTVAAGSQFNGYTIKTRRYVSSVASLAATRTGTPNTPNGGNFGNSNKNDNSNKY